MTCAIVAARILVATVAFGCAPRGPQSHAQRPAAPVASTSVAAGQQKAKDEEKRAIASPPSKPDAKPDAHFAVRIAYVVANQRHVESIPEEYRATAIVDGTLSYVVCGSITDGIDPSQNLGLIIDYKRGFEPGNITINPLFLDRIWQIARDHIDVRLLWELAKSETNAVAIVDERVRDVNVPMVELIQDIIGVYRWENNRVIFVPNLQFTYFSKHGFMKLTPFIRERLNESPH